MDHDLVVVLRVAEVLIDMLVLLHVHISRVTRLSNVLDRSESLFVTVIDLDLALFFAHNPERGLLERITNTVVGVLAEEVTIDLSSLDRVSADVGRVRCNLFLVGVRDESRCNIKFND